MGQLLSKSDLSYSNHNFWWYYISAFQGYDDAKDLPLMEAIESVQDINEYVTNFEEWYKAFAPKEEANEGGMLKHPNIVDIAIVDKVRLTIEFHIFEIQYYLNNIYFGNMGGHFEAWFFTWNELLSLDNDTELFWFLLPMTGVEESQRKQAERLVSERLKQIPIFSKKSNYITRCIVSALVIEGAYAEIAAIGTTCTQPHSVRNIEKYPRYKDDVIKLNQILMKLVRT